MLRIGSLQKVSETANASDAVAATLEVAAHSASGQGRGTPHPPARRRQPGASRRPSSLRKGSVRKAEASLGSWMHCSRPIPSRVRLPKGRREKKMQREEKVKRSGAKRSAEGTPL